MSVTDDFQPAYLVGDVLSSNAWTDEHLESLMKTILQIVAARLLFGMAFIATLKHDKSGALILFALSILVEPAVVNSIVGWFSTLRSNIGPTSPNMLHRKLVSSFRTGLEYKPSLEELHRFSIRATVVSAILFPLCVFAVFHFLHRDYPFVGVAFGGLAIWIAVFLKGFIRTALRTHRQLSATE